MATRALETTLTATVGTNPQVANTFAPATADLSYENDLISISSIDTKCNFQFGFHGGYQT
jgi:hypothetical protein